MLKAVESLIQYSRENDYLSSDFKILGHRQVRATECPGDRLFNEIRTWKHYSVLPSNPNDHN